MHRVGEIVTPNKATKTYFMTYVIHFEHLSTISFQNQVNFSVILIKFRL